MIYIEKETDTLFDFPDYDRIIIQAVETVFEDKNLPAFLDVNVLIVDPAEMKKINNDARGEDSVTDVLSFPYFDYNTPGVFEEEIEEEYENILGDIIICAEKVIRQAEEYGHEQMRELSFLIVHSMLHLIGYDHIEEEDSALMMTEEKRLMGIIGIPR
ncbi:MAG: rRNA maturation RNase YbeY [Lachnospiraceae bacterium]|jgi:probable rRNA maturation factor